MNEKDLSKLVEETMEAKKLLNQAKNNEKKYTELLKKEFDKRGMSKEVFEDVGLKVSYIEQTKSTVDEEKLITIIENLANNTKNKEVADKIKSVFEIKTVVNEEKLEELMFSNYINIEDIAPAVNEKKYKTLRINTIK